MSRLCLNSSILSLIPPKGVYLQCLRLGQPQVVRFLSQKRDFTTQMTGGIACPQGKGYWRLETDRRGQKVQEILGYRTQAIQSEEVGPRLGRRSPSNDSQRRMKYYNDSQRKNKEDSKMNASMSVC